MTLTEIIISRIQEYSYQNRLKPTMITVHPTVVQCIINENLELFKNKTFTPPIELAIMGIKVIRSEDLNEGQFILTTDLENYKNIH